VSPALTTRLAIAIPGIAVAIAVVVVGGALFAIALAAIAVLGLYELYSLTAAHRPLRWAGYAGTILVVLLAWGYDPGERGVILGLGLSILLVAVGGLILPRRDEITVRMATTLLGVAYLGMPLALLVLTRELPDGAGAVANVLVGVWVFDTASYAGGRLWGRTPIAPRTSPGKTVEGAAIGLAAGTLAVWIAGLYMDWISGWESLLLGLAICPAAYLGDLFESMLKRDVGAKDSGRLLLAHGGVLDRFDALLLGAVAGYFVTIWLVY
jgi:phosphatidate cytidylyltransferase